MTCNTGAMALGLDALAGGKRLLRALAGATVGAALCDRSFTELSVSLGGAMVRMIVHVGAHRTATSFVQGTLLKNAKKLGGVGVGYRSIGGAAKPLRILRDSDDEQDIRIAAEAFCDRFRTSHPAALVSWEGLLGMPFVNGVLYGGRGPYLKMLQRAAELISSELEIILTIRRQDDFINSWYAQIVKRGATITAEQYLAEIDFACLDWMPVLEDFRRIFNHVSIIPYEMSLENDIGYLQEFLNTAGIPVDATKLDLDQGKQNASDTAEALEIILFTNRYAKFASGK